MSELIDTVTRFERSAFWQALVSQHMLKPYENSLLFWHQDNQPILFAVNTRKHSARSLTCCYSCVWLNEFDFPKNDGNLVSFLAELRANGITEIDLTHLLSRNLGFSFLKSLRDAGWSVTHIYPKSHNWKLPVGRNTFENYWNNLPSRLRSTANRKSRLLSRTANWSISIATTSTTCMEALEHFYAVYTQSWKQQEESPEFLDRLFRWLAADGKLRVATLAIDGCPSASQVWIIEGRKAYIFKLAHLETAKKYSPGTLLTKEMFKHVMESKSVTEIDFMYGDDAYKADWMTTCEEIVGIHAYNLLTVRGLVGFIRFRVLRTVRNTLNRRLHIDER